MGGDDQALLEVAATKTLKTTMRSRTERLRSISELDHVFDEGQVEDWNGYGAKPVAARDTFEVALRFLNALPSTTPSPEVSLDPDGEVSFDWYNGKERVFSISIGALGRLSYAGIFGHGVTAHGTEVFADTIPESVIHGIKRLGIEP